MTETVRSDLPLDMALAHPAPPPARRKAPRRWLWAALALALALTGAGLGLRARAGATAVPAPASAVAPVAVPGEVVGLGRIMPRGDIGTVAAPYGAGDARVAEILVNVGDEVARGQPLARLDNTAALESAVLLAEANRDVREATLAQTRATVGASRDEARATLEQAEAAAREAASELARTEELATRGVVTQAVLESVRAAERSAALAVTRAAATLARFSGVIEDQPDVAVARANLRVAEADLARARADLGRAVVVAPAAGTILDIHATPGQRPPAEGILDLGDTSRMMAEVEIYQDRIAAVAPGQPAALVAAALGETLRGTVESVGLTIGRQGLVSDDTAANKDARVVRVLVALDAPSSALASRYINLEVIARIDTAGALR